MSQPWMRRFSVVKWKIKKKRKKKSDEIIAGIVCVDNNSLARIVVRMMEDEIGKDDLDTLSSVTTELVVTVH